MKDTLLDTLIRNSFCVMGFVICFFFYFGSHVVHYQF
ncbi:unnamed protein product [Brassica rapa]|uniref:Uncharacterized protein n=1 Tax=Brassica campestris TaxID=3711 RepID=A0A8D9D629_BRACM|nr:unnamed protein product [Brassica rapa]